MANQPSQDQLKEKEPKLWIWALAAAGIIYLWYGLIYVDVLGTGWAMNDVARRNIGFEGISALVNGLAFVAFYFAVKLQREDLKVTKNELIKTREAHESQLEHLRQEAQRAAMPRFLFRKTDAGPLEMDDVHIQYDGAVIRRVLLYTAWEGSSVLRPLGYWAPGYEHTTVVDSEKRTDIFAVYQIVTGQTFVTWYTWWPELVPTSGNAILRLEQQWPSEVSRDDEGAVREYLDKFIRDEINDRVCIHVLGLG